MINQQNTNDFSPLLEYDHTSAMVIAENPYQGNFKKVLCVCSAGVLRSPTAALVLSLDPFNYNTRSAGIENYALIPITKVLLHWADEVVCMTQNQKIRLIKLIDKQELYSSPVVICLDIPDSFSYRDDELVTLIEKNYKLKVQK